MDICFTVSPDLMRRVIRRVSFYYFGWTRIVLLVFLLIIDIVISFMEKFTWLGGFFIGIFIFRFIELIGSSNRSIKLASLYKDSPISMSFTEEYVTRIVPGWSSNIHWQMFSQILKIKSAWVFVIDTRSEYLVIPSESINDELSEWIGRKVSENKGIIRTLK
jgi:hypothetical protein